MSHPPLPSGRSSDEVLRDVRAAGARRRWRNRALAAAPMVLIAAVALTWGGGADDGTTRILVPARPSTTDTTSDPAPSTQTTCWSAPATTAFGVKGGGEIMCTTASTDPSGPSQTTVGPPP